MGKYRDMLYCLQQEKGGAYARRGLYETHPQTELPQMDPSYKDYRWFQGGSGKLARLSLLEYRACRVTLPRVASNSATYSFLPLVEDPELVAGRGRIEVRVIPVFSTLTALPSGLSW